MYVGVRERMWRSEEKESSMSDLLILTHQPVDYSAPTNDTGGVSMMGRLPAYLSPPPPAQENIHGRNVT